MHPPLIDNIRPAAEQPLSQPKVDRAFFGRLVRSFYERVRRDDRLGPIFARHVEADWEPHLENMTDFWSLVVRKTDRYHGRPVPAHLKLKEVVESDFNVWLGLFRKTASDLCAPDVAAVFIARAERITQSLRLAMIFRVPQGDAATGQAPCA